MRVGREKERERISDVITGHDTAARDNRAAVSRRKRRCWSGYGVVHEHT